MISTGEAELVAVRSLRRVPMTTTSLPAGSGAACYAVSAGTVCASAGLDIATAEADSDSMAMVEKRMIETPKLCAKQ